MSSVEHKQKTFSYLRQSRYFKTVSDETLEKFLALSNVRYFNEGEIVLAQGQSNDEVSVIVTGKVAVKVDGLFICHLRRRGDIFGEMSVITGEPASATIEAAEDLQIVTISSGLLREIKGDAFHELHHLFYEWFSRILSEKLYLTSQKAKLHEDLSQRLKADLESAKQVQHEVFFSNLVPIPNFPVSVRCEFADILGGDFYGVMAIEEDRYGIFIGDVSGHGTPASLLAVSVLSHLQSLKHRDLSTSAVVERLNDLWWSGAPHNRFVTFFYGLYDVRTRELTYTYAGHPPALVLRRKEVLKLSATSGLPLGILETHEAEFAEARFVFRPEDRLVLYTDGVFERIPEKQGKSSLSQLTIFIEGQAGLPSTEITDAVYEYATAFSPRVHDDDFTLMVFEQR